MSDLRTTPERLNTTHPVIDEPVSRTGRTLSVVGFVCAALALFVLPVVLGPAAIICGIVGWRSGDRLGMWAAAAGLVCMLGGLAIASAVVNNSHVGNTGGGY
jgi:hypothetical protein